MNTEQHLTDIEDYLKQLSKLQDKIVEQYEVIIELENYFEANMSSIEQDEFEERTDEEDDKLHEISNEYTKLFIEFINENKIISGEDVLIDLDLAKEIQKIYSKIYHEYDFYNGHIDLNALSLIKKIEMFIENKHQ